MHAGTFHRGLLHPRHWLSWLSLIPLYLFTCLPVALRRRLMAPLGRKSLFNSAKRLRVVKANLRICLAELSDAEREALLQRYAAYAGFAIGEMAWMWFRSLKRIKRRTRMENLHHLQAAQQSGRPLIFLVPHMFWLEYGAFAIGQELPIAGIFNTFKNPVLDWLVGYKRAQLSEYPIRRQSGSTIQQVIERANQGLGIHHLMDEDLGVKNSVFAPYFGEDKATLANLSEILQATQALVVPLSTRYEAAEDRFVVHVGEALDWSAIATDAVAVATEVNRAYEAMVRLSPDQYMWNLRYFRSRPPGDPRDFYHPDFEFPAP